MTLPTKERNISVHHALYAVQVNGVAVGKSFTFSIKFINININAVNNRGLVTTTSIMMSEFTKLFHRTLI